MRKLLVAALGLLFLAGCGKKIVNEEEEIQLVASAQPFSAGLNVQGLLYHADGTYVRFEYPYNQTANYEIAFCNPGFSACSKIINVICTAPGQCTKAAGQVGTMANGTGNGTRSILYTYSPTGQTYSIRVRASNSQGATLWLESSTCTNTFPATCQSN